MKLTIEFWVAILCSQLWVATGNDGWHNGMGAVWLIFALCIWFIEKRSAAVLDTTKKEER